MEIGVLHFFQNFRDGHDDAEVMARNLKIADLYEPAGFDFCLIPEHHFDGYMMTPVPFDFLSYMAGRTKRIKLGPGAIIVPWNDPYRAAAHLISLDHLSNGRAIIGLGRGLAKVEMDHFGIDMNDTRPMYDEGARKILEAVRTGSFPGGGRFYGAQNRSPMRPKPLTTDWDDRTYCIGMSPPSAIEAGRLGGRLMALPLGSWESFRDNNFHPYREAFREATGREPGPMVLGIPTIVHSDRERAHELSTRYFGNYFDSVQDFYKLRGDHLEGVKGYEAYADLSRQSRQVAYEQMRQAAADASIHGTPGDVIEQLRELRRVLEHPYDLCAQLDGGDMPAEVVEQSIAMLGRDVLPVVQAWDDEFETRVKH